MTFELIDAVLKQTTKIIGDWLQPGQYYYVPGRHEITFIVQQYPDSYKGELNILAQSLSFMQMGMTK